MQRERDFLTVLFDDRGLVDEAYKDGSGSEYGFSRTTSLHSTSTPSRNAQTQTITKKKRISSGYRVPMAASSQAMIRSELKPEQSGTLRQLQSLQLQSSPVYTWSLPILPDSPRTLHLCIGLAGRACGSRHNSRLGAEQAKPI